MSTPHVSILNAIVNPTPLLKLTQVTIQKHHLEVLMNRTITSPMLAGRLAQFITNWKILTQDQWNLQAIRGYKLEMEQSPLQIKPMPAISCSIDDGEIISMKVR